MTLADVELWLSHDISVPGVPPEFVRRAQDEFLWLCAEHKAVGRRNGSKAGAAAEAAAKVRRAWQAGVWLLMVISPREWCFQRRTAEPTG